MSDKHVITIKTTVNMPVEKVWIYWTEPRHIKNWNNASSDWHTPTAENDFRENGTFNYRMEAKDGSAGFDLYGVYEEIKLYENIKYTLGDQRKVEITFVRNGKETEIIESFESENLNSLEMQKAGWQSILDNFKKYAEQLVL